MDRIDEILDNYEKDLKKAEEGECKKIIQRDEFRNESQDDYKKAYKPRLEEIVQKLLDKKHRGWLEERPPDEIFYGFSLVIIPRHLMTCPADRYYPDSLASRISFVANEHTLSVDIEVQIRPNIEKQESRSFEKIPKDFFNEDILIQKVSDFLRCVFDETLVLDFKT
jgi:hypothetical protein